MSYATQCEEWLALVASAIGGALVVGFLSAILWLSGDSLMAM